MADKAEKIAAARKKLKQYQARQKDRDHDPHQCQEPPGTEPTPPDIGQPTADISTQPPYPNSVNPQIGTLEQDDFNRGSFSSVEYVPASTSTDGTTVSIANYFSNSTFPFTQQPGVVDLFENVEPKLAPVPAPPVAPTVEARPPEPPVDASLYNINKLSDEIGNLIANANADLGPQNTILELESEKADLARQLNAEKLENDELRLRLRNQQSLVDELKNETDKLRLENSTRLTVEMGPLQEQLQMQIQAVGVLVGEKAELTASLSKCKSLLQERTAETNELQNRLQDTTVTVQKLQSQLTEATSHSQRYEQLEQTIASQVGEYQREAERFRKLYEDLQDDIAELRQKLTVRNEEYQSAQQTLEQTRSELGLAKIRIDQLTTDDGQDYNAKIESLTQQNLIKAQQIKDLQEIIKQIGTERDQSSQQYQNYVLHLNKEISNLAEKIQELTDENNRLSKSEETAVRFANELERQIQQQMQKQQSVYDAQQEVKSESAEGEDPKLREEHERLKAELNTLRNSYDKLNSEKEELMNGNVSKEEQQKSDYETQMKEYEEQITQLQLTVERLQLDKPDVAKLLAEIESGRVGASRAVTQNQELKYQLEEMQRAFVQISNDKLNLTDKLQTELHLGKEMKANYGNLESELAAIREKLHYKDEEMIRLTHENTELNKQIYQQNQEIDRLRYYESRSNDAATLQRELELQKRTTEDLRRQLREGSVSNEQPVLVNGDQQPVDDHSPETGFAQLQQEIETLRQEKEELLKALNRFQQDRTEGPPNGAVGNAFDRQSSIVSSIPTMEAMEKLQQRFKRTMLEVAELTEEKQRLEHLVMQLQGETETIGEYITLYQQQRRLLKQKDMERDLQLQQLADDREMMKLKLKELNYLVHRLVQEQQSGDEHDHHDHHHHHHHPASLNSSSNSSNYNYSQLETTNPISPGYDDSTTVSGSPAAAGPTVGMLHGADGEPHSPLPLPKVHIKPTETAGRILSLLTDIKEANIPYGSGVQHCSCCSGRLETV
ncbi:golgin subfamily A member 2 [Anopheles maculipalpis]|uniref:golgin subfamily A member 2 n=1 Tax=Anopheles maculipalpis TaxID=1496333 RepID=UPI002158D9DE|nr:golgin subfamily A member 2 [Anopheles maculipalpis]